MREAHADRLVDVKTREGVESGSIKRWYRLYSHIGNFVPRVGVQRDGLAVVADATRSIFLEEANHARTSGLSGWHCQDRRENSATEQLTPPFSQMARGAVAEFWRAAKNQNLNATMYE